MRFRVAPHPASSSCTGDGSSSFLESRILWRSLPSESPGCPESSLLQSRLPMSLRVAPNPASSGCADGESPGCPESSLPQRTGWWISGLPRLSHLPAFPALNLRVAPNLHLFQRRLLLIFGLPRFSTPSARCRWIPRFPRFSHPPVAPYPRLRVSPNPAFTAGSMMTPRLNSNFASSARPRMNLRVQSGLAHSHQTLDASSISFRPPTAVSSCGTPIFTLSLHRPVWLELRFQFPTGSPVG